MNADDDPLRTRDVLRRQLVHWRIAIDRLGNLDDVASPTAWGQLERYLGLAIRESLEAAITRLRRHGVAVAERLASGDQDETYEHLLDLRGRYLRTETTVHFFADALASRTSPKMSLLLNACDSMATTAMDRALQPIGMTTPPALTFVDKGLGAAILKAGLRLWDPTVENPVAAIKVARHNLLRPTALVHEAGHQVAHMVGWNDELQRMLRRTLPGRLGALWSSWASEVAADAFGFVHTGYASIVALHDVVDGGNRTVFHHLPGDPHPVSWIRVLLGLELCRSEFGHGPWDSLADVWVRRHPLEAGPADLLTDLAASREALPDIAKLVLRAPLESFGSRPLIRVIDPQQVAPDRLAALAATTGPSLLRSPHLLRTETLRLLALTGLQAATDPVEAARRQETWMLNLGATAAAA